MKDLKYIEEDLKERLSPERFTHSVGVLETAEKLAKKWGGNLEKCKIAALVHDCGKLRYTEDILKQAELYKIALTEEDLKCPQIIHSYLSEAIAKNVYEIDDHEILRAVRNHTLGSQNMDLTEKIIFVADMIEPSRKGEIFEEIRKEAFENLDCAVLKAFNRTIEYNLKKGRYVHGETLKNRNKTEELLNGFKN